MRAPGLRKALMSAVIMTAATFLALMSWELTLRPWRWSTLATERSVAPALLSPSPASPTTRPYPTNWLSRPPSIRVRSLTREAWREGLKG